MTELEYWGAVWCGPCRSMKPVLNELEAEGVKINRRDTDDEITVAREKRIGGVPTMIILKDGKEVGRMVGAKNKATILYELARHS